MEQEHRQNRLHLLNHKSLPKTQTLNAVFVHLPVHLIRQEAGTEITSIWNTPQPKLQAHINPAFQAAITTSR